MGYGVGLDVQVGYDRVSNSMVAWSVMDSIIKFLNKEIADAAIFGTKHCSNRWGWVGCAGRV